VPLRNLVDILEVKIYRHTTASRATGKPQRKWIDKSEMIVVFSVICLTLTEATRLVEDRRAWRSEVSNLG